MSFVICQPTSEQIALLGAELDGGWWIGDWGRRTADTGGGSWDGEALDALEGPMANQLPAQRSLLANIKMRIFILTDTRASHFAGPTIPSSPWKHNSYYAKWGECALFATEKELNRYYWFLSYSIKSRDIIQCP